MEPVLTRCGFRCDLCLAYRPNVERNPSNRQKLSDGWFKYFGFRIPPEEIACDGCLADAPGAVLLDRGCPVRPCAIARGLDTCARCSDYGCERLQQRLIEAETWKASDGGDIPEDDYRCFLLPYANKRRLDALRELQG